MSRRALRTLERVLDLRRHAERLARLRVARRMAEERAARRELERANSALRRVQDRLRRRGARPLSGEVLERMAVEATEFEHRVADRRRRWREAAGALAEAQAAWRSRRIDRESIERVLERRRAAFAQERARREQKELDEAALTRFRRRPARHPEGGQR